MKRFYLIIALSFLCATGQTEDSKPLYNVGETWIYDMNGTEYGIFGEEKLEEREIRKIAGIREIDGEKRWVVNIKSGSSIMKEYIDEAGFSHSIDFEGRSRMLSADCVPPSPDYMNVRCAIGETQKNKFELSPQKNSLIKLRMEMEYTRERLEDETVTVPAGTYENCIHYRETGHLIIGTPPQSLKVLFTCNVWIHPSVKSVVKDITEFEPVIPDKKQPAPKTKKTKLLRRYSPGRNR